MTPSAHRALTPAQVVAIRERYAAGESRVDLGFEFGVSDTAIGRIAHRQSYAECGGPITPRGTWVAPVAERSRILAALGKLGPASAVEVALEAGLQIVRTKHLLREMRRSTGVVRVTGHSASARWHIIGANPSPLPLGPRRHLTVVPVEGWGLVRGADVDRLDDCARMSACLAAWCARHRSGSARCPWDCLGYSPVSRAARLVEAVDGRGMSEIARAQ